MGTYLRSWHPRKWALHATNAMVTSPRLYRTSTCTNPIAVAMMQRQQPRTLARTALSQGSYPFLRYGFYVVSSLKQKLTKLPIATNKKLFENIKMQNCVSQITPWVDVLNGAWTTFWHSDVPQCHQRRQAHILTEHSLAQAVMQMQFTHAPSPGRLYMEVLVCR